MRIESTACTCLHAHGAYHTDCKQWGGEAEKEFVAI